MKPGMEVGRGQTVFDGDPVPLLKRGRATSNFPPMFIVVKRLDESRCHLVGRYISAQATLC